MSQLIPIAANAGIAAILLTTAIALRGDTIHGARHRNGHIRPVPADWNPLTHRVREAVAHYAACTRTPLVHGVNERGAL